METYSIMVKVEDESRATASQIVNALLPLLKTAGDNVSAEPIPSNSKEQDLGTFIIALFGTKFAVEVAKVIIEIAKRFNSSKVSIYCRDGTTIVVENVARSTVMALVEKYKEC